MKEVNANYAIVCSSRTGSSHLCSMLKYTWRAGFPTEYFNVTWAKKYGLPDEDTEGPELSNYINKILKEFSTPNKVFGIKVIGVKHQWRFLINSKLNITHWIWLQRRDQVLQAISRHKAGQTNIWSSSVEMQPYVPYNRHGIQWCLDAIEKETQFYENFFQDKSHMILWYEDDLCDKPEKTIIDILNYIGVDSTDLPPIKSDRVIMRDESNYEFKKRFLSGE